ncbi:MAG: DUF349 domain-containing protein [Salinibacterium sp.]|nr:DUF349 domain-containing protein [Salinibacterium sp.]
MVADEQSTWGRVDESGTVFVRESEGERAVGQFPDGTAEEALAYFGRKFIELAGQVTLLEQRVKRGAPAADVAKTIVTLSASIATANAVGNLAALADRVAALDGTVTELTEKQREEAKAAVITAITERTALVIEIETLAAADSAKAQWKAVTASVDDIFARWQKHQTEGPRLPKSEANALWVRFRAARTTIDSDRRAYFAKLDAAHRQAREAKQALVEKAEALSSQGAAAIPAYRALLDSWKAAGRAGKKLDDTLWAKFKAAGDALYSAKAEVDAKDSIEFGANLTAKLALLTEAEVLLKETDRLKAKEALLSIQKRWDNIGKVPRDQVRGLDDRLRLVETEVRKLDEEHWQKNNPERQQRSDGFAGQLADAIAKLERELDEARAKGDEKKIAAAQEALDARKAWLGAVKS